MSYGRIFAAHRFRSFSTISAHWRHSGGLIEYPFSTFHPLLKFKLGHYQIVTRRLAEFSAQKDARFALKGGSHKGRPFSFVALIGRSPGRAAPGARRYGNFAALGRFGAA
jgi:hypothetical protein